MKIRKRIGILLSLLAAVLFCVGLVACGNKDNNGMHAVKFTGESVKTTTVYVKDGDTVDPIKTPTREGYGFAGWYKEEESYNFSTPVHESFTLTAHWAVRGESGLLGEGTAASPYLLGTAEELQTVAQKVNAGDEAFVNAFYRLTADIDLSKVSKYEAIGKIIKDSEIQGFSGDFDGNGYKIKGLNFNSTVRSAGYFGVFGATYMANIYNLTVENIDYSILCYNTEQVEIYIGGVAGYACNTNFTNVTVTGEIETGLMPSNRAYIGGIAGVLVMRSANGQSYISYTQNCYTKITTSIVDEGTDDGGSLESAVLGGIFGYVTSTAGTASVIGCATAGKLHGGTFTGGVVGYISENVSIIDCFSAAAVEPTATEVSYAGGIVGRGAGDSIIIDCFSAGAVTGKQGTSNNYQSRKGGIIAYAEPDDYNWYFTAGTAVVNSYFSSKVTGGGTVTDSHGKSATLSKELAKDTLHWAEECWVIDGLNTKPTAVLRCTLKDSYTVSFVDNYETAGTQKYSCDRDGYTVMGHPAALKNVAPYVFWDWELADDIVYRYYLPVVKDMTLTARWENVEGIADDYTGTYVLHEGEAPTNAGVIRLNEDGTLEWTRSSSRFGTYRFNGKYFLAEIGTDSVCGEFAFGEGGKITFTFEQDAGMTGTVYYTFTRAGRISLLGEYFDMTSGDLLTFAGDDTMSFQSHITNHNAYVRGTYDEKDNTVTVTQGGTSKTAVLTISKDGSSLTVTEAGGAFDLVEGTVFSKMGAVDYTDKGFAGEYSVFYFSKGDDPTGNMYTIALNADGSGTITNPFRSEDIRYYFFERDCYIKFFDEAGNVSAFFYEADLGIFWGDFMRGDANTYSPSVLTPTTQGRTYAASTATKDSSPKRDYMIFFTADGANKYVLKNGVLDKEAVVEGEFKDGAIITIEGKRFHLTARNLNDYNQKCLLTPIGADEGAYSYNGASFYLDGMGTIYDVLGGEKKGIYSLNDNRIFVLFDDDTLFAFDYTAAKAASGAVTTLLQDDGFMGVWYGAGAYEDLETGEKVPDPYYLRLVIDGFGNTTIFYNKYGLGYEYNWGKSSGWGIYYKTSTGIHVQFNSVQPADIVFYYDMNVAYSASLGYMGEKTLAKKGYDGPTARPVIDPARAGQYTGSEKSGASVILNLRADCTGDFKGAPFTGVYNGSDTIRFVLGTLTYTLTFGQKIVISYGDEEVELTLGGPVTDVFPAAFEGTWTCNAVTGLNGGTKSFTMQKSGSIAFDGVPLVNVVYDYQSLTITAKNGSISYTFKYNAEDGTFSVAWDDEDSRSWSGVFTKD